MGTSCFTKLVIKSCLSHKPTSKNPIFKFFLFWVLLLFAHQASVLADSDESVLLELKNSLSDPSGLLRSWNKTSGLTGSNHCGTWLGVTCDLNSRVVSLNITGNAGQGKENVFFCSDSAQFPVYGYGFRRHCVGSNGKLVGKLLASVAKLTELKILSLPFNGLFGELPVEIWGMEKLEVIDLEGNSLSGSLPVRFAGLKGLRVLNLGFNDIHGEIPNSFAGLSNLEILNLAGNSINGTLQGYLGQIKGVYLSFNQLTGSIPGELGENCAKLEHLDLSGNFLGGQIPRSIGGCGKLRSLLLYSNMLEEVIPSEIGGLTNLEVLDVSRNILSGSIPVELGNCTNLSVLVLSNEFDPVHDMNSTIPAFLLNAFGSMNDDSNYYQGGIPEEITNLRNLRILWAPRTNLEGRIPVNWATCEKLEMVNLAHNFLSGGVPHQLSQCKKLHFLDLSANKLSGELFQGISVPCMTLFDVSGNSLSGSIPTFVNNSCLLSSSILQTFSQSAAYMMLIAYRAQVGFSLPFVKVDTTAIAIHNFGQNNFSGSLKALPVPPKLVGNQTVYAFLAGNNNLSGPFPENVLGSCDGLDALVVNISFNRISGPFPPSLGTSCRSLLYLDAYGNQIAGSFLPSFGNSTSLAALNLSCNLLQGQIPNSIGLMSNLKYLSLANNNLSGSIPPSLVKLQSLQVLDLSSNSLSGEIPNDLGKLKNLSILLLNNNRLSGQLPSDLANVSSLTAFNVSVNNLSGPLLSNAILMKCPNVLGNHFSQSCQTVSLAVPSTDMQKSGDSQNDVAAGPTSGAPTGNNGFNSIEIASIACASAIVTVLVALIILFVYTRKCKPRSNFGSVRKELTVFQDIGVPLTFENVVRATSGFNASNCIGSGGFGATYKAEISPGKLVAIKRLAVGRFQQGVQQFHAEIRTLGRFRHPNLVTLIGYHASETEMFLIYNYLPGGNLEKFIHERSTRAADWRVLHKIALDIAGALAYLHEQCVPRVLHRDVKPSNILLDEDHNAYLSDFGLARLLGTSETHATTGVAGTFGYVAPEYAMTCRVSDKADVYSYGVVLLELLSDKKALDPSFSSYGNGFNIVAWACMLLRQGRAKEFFTGGLWDVGPHDDLVEVLHLAVVCTVDSLSTRPTMKHVVNRLKRLEPPPH